MSVPADHCETTLLDTQGLLVKSQSYRAVLTSRRIILTGEADHIPRDISLQEVWRIGQDMDPSGDPVIIISLPAAGGMVHSIILHFPRRTFPNALRLRDLWASEINGILQQSVPRTRTVTRQAATPAPAFCSKCGNRLTGGSAFCDRCGTKIPYPGHQGPSDQPYSQSRNRVIQPEISTGMIEIPWSDPAAPAMSYPRARQIIPATAPSRREVRKGKSFFTGSILKKPAVIIGLLLAGIVIVATAYIIAIPSGSPALNQSITGLNVSLPNLSAVALPGNPLITTTTRSEIPGSPVSPEETFNPEVTPTRPALEIALGDPAEVLAMYPSLFNMGDGEGIHALLSGNMQSHYSPEALNTELAAAQSNGYTIEGIEVQDQVIEEDTAVIVTDIYWNIEGSTVISSPRIFLVYENEQWKLDSMILQP